MDTLLDNTNDLAKAIQLPMLRCTLTDVCGVLFAIVPHTESWEVTLEKMQAWIIGEYTESQLDLFRQLNAFSDEDLERLAKALRVISPITLSLYVHKLQAEAFAKMSDAEKERSLLKRIPDRFKPRLKGNQSCRNGREPTAEETDRKMAAAEKAKTPKPPSGIADILKDLLSPNPPQYIKDFVNQKP